MPAVAALVSSMTVRKKKQKALIFHLVLTAAAVILFITAASIGSSDTGLKDILSMFTGEIEEKKRIIIEQIRIPRAIMAITCGFSLAVAGVAMQGLFRNPLAEPGILGINSGASLGAALVIVFGSLLLPGIDGGIKFYLLPAGAFCGALFITVTAVKIGTVKGRTHIYLLLLAGIAIQAIAGALLGLMTYISTDEQLRNMIFWSMGNLGYAGWHEILFIIPILALCSWMLFKKANALNLLLLGESEAGHMGVDVDRLKKSLIIWTSIAVAVTVAFTGSIGFIGLVAPHLVRLKLGPDHRYLLFGAGLAGACLLCLADILSRSFTEDVIPVGIITALAGAPLFLKLLISEKKAES